MITKTEKRKITQATGNFIARTLVAAFLNLAVQVGVQAAISAIIEQFFPEISDFAKAGIQIAFGTGTNLLTSKKIKRLVDTLLGAKNYLSTEEIEEILVRHSNNIETIIIEGELVN